MALPEPSRWARDGHILLQAAPELRASGTPLPELRMITGAVAVDETRHAAGSRGVRPGLDEHEGHPAEVRDRPAS